VNLLFFHLLESSKESLACFASHEDSLHEGSDSRVKMRLAELDYYPHRHDGCRAHYVSTGQMY